MGYYKKEFPNCKLLMLDSLENTQPPRRMDFIQGKCHKRYIHKNSNEFSLMISLYNYPNSTIEVRDD